MTKISFSRKHIMMSAILAISLIGFVLIFWGILIQPKAAKVTELKKQVSTLTTEIQTEQAKADKLKNLPALLETTMVTEVPKIPNGMMLADYFQGLAKNTSVSIQHMTFEDKAVFPVTDEGSTDTEMSEHQIRNLVMSFDVIGGSEVNLLSFIEKLENDNRFTKVTQVNYRHNPDSAGEESFSYSSTMSLSMYYLSTYETGKPLAVGEVEEKK